MKSLIIYDSQFGNTERVAKAIASVFRPPNKVTLNKINELRINKFSDLDILIVGSPTQGGRPTENLLKFLEQISTNGLANIEVAAFDTRFLEKDQKLFLRILMKTVGYAAPRIIDLLKRKGGKQLAPPEGFIVTGKKGPLAQGEIERAKAWGRTILTT